MNHRSFLNRLLMVCFLVTVVLFGLLLLNRVDANANLAIPVSPESAVSSYASGDALIDQGDLAYVMLLDSNLVALVDTASHVVVGTIDAGASGCVGPERAKITPDGSQAYFPCNYSGSVLVVETIGNTVITNVIGIPSPNDVTFTRDGAYALIGTVSGGIVVIDTMTYEIVDTISNSARIGSLAAHPWLDVVYATSYDGHVLVIDTVSFTIIDSIPFGGEVWDVVVSPDGQWVYASDRYGAGVAVIDAETNTLETTITELGEMCGLEISPDGSLVYAFGLDSGVHIIDGTAFSLLTTIGGVGYAYEGATTADGSQLFVGNWSDQVIVIDTQMFTVDDQITLPGPDPRGVAIRPQYVTAGVYLSPPTQTNQSAPGQVVTHEFTQLNLTGSSDSFDLELGSHAWDATLSTDQVGPLENGESASFTVDVTVPVSADWYTTDSVDVTATSVTNPADYPDTASLTTEAYAPPQIGVSPDSLTSTQRVGDVATQTLTISNGNGVSLAFDITEGPDLGSVFLARLDEPAGSTVFMDDSGNDNHGSCSGETCPTAGVAGRFGTALSFDGSDDFIDILDHDTLDVGYHDFTLASWVKTDTTSFGRIISKGSAYCTDPGYYFAIDPYGILYPRIEATSNGSCIISLDGTTVVNDGAWHFLAIVVDRNEGVSIYVDGQFDVHQDIDTSMYDFSNPYNLTIGLDGNHTNDGYFQGTIDELAIFNRALTAEELEILYTSGISGFQIPWLSIEPVSGSIPTNSSQEVSVTFDATGLQPNTYTSTINIQSNDPVKPLVTVPVTMTVIPTPSLSLLPDWQQGHGNLGESLTYTYTLTNLGNSIDEFSLQVSALWESKLSANTTGLLDPGESFILTLQVTIPPDAQIGDTDTALITASSMLDPLVIATAKAKSMDGTKLMLPLVFKQ